MQISKSSAALHLPLPRISGDIWLVSFSEKKIKQFISIFTVQFSLFRLHLSSSSSTPYIISNSPWRNKQKLLHEFNPFYAQAKCKTVRFIVSWELNQKPLLQLLLGTLEWHNDQKDTSTWACRAHQVHSSIRPKSHITLQAACKSTYSPQSWSGPPSNLP
jgi:hypothetical protein